MPIDATLRASLFDGLVIPAHPLALDADRKLDERRQRALTRYYCDAGAGGVAVGVHTTQFAIRDPRVGLFEPVLRLALETVLEWERQNGSGSSKSRAFAARRRRRRAKRRLPEKPATTSDC